MSDETIVEKISYRGLIIQLIVDYGGDCNPREWDNFGLMVCFHRHYLLGDGNQNMTVGELKDLVNRKDVVSLPLYLYDHSGITMRTTPFSCPWDSGKVGHIYADREMILKEYGGKRLTKGKKAKALKVLESEVTTYDYYLTGQVYWYTVTTPSGDSVGSCGGYFGPEGYKLAVEEAKSEADHYLKQLEANPM